VTGFACLLADPPWEQPLVGPFKKRRNGRRAVLPYPTLPIGSIAAMPVAKLAADDAHVWLWTTNATLRAGFEVLDAWGFKFLAPVTWVKPSGCGAWFVHRTQTLLFGYRGKLRMDARFRPTVLAGSVKPGEHSRKPPSSYELVEAVSPGPRLELFARSHRAGWSVWGNEVESDIELRV